MKEHKVTEISTEEFFKMVESSVSKVCKDGAEETATTEGKENPEFYTKKELQTRWNVGESAINRFQKNGLKRTIIGGLVRFRFSNVITFEKEKVELITKAKKRI